MTNFRVRLLPGYRASRSERSAPLRIAEAIDWHNLNHDDGAVICSSEFDAWNSTYFDDWCRLTNTLAGTTAHELGHLHEPCCHRAFGPIGEADAGRPAQ